LLAVEVDPDRIYEEFAPDRLDDHPSIAACLKAL
jgi:hypothetical protein